MDDVSAGNLKVVLAVTYFGTGTGNMTQMISNNECWSDVCLRII